VRLIFLGTPEFAVPILERLLQDGHEVVAVYTRPEAAAGRGQRLTQSPVKRLAVERGLRVAQPTSLRPPQEVERLAQLQPEAIVLAAYGLLLPQAVLDVPPLGCLNVHPSLLPRHRGPSPVAAAILAGDEVTGVSIMLMDSGLDTGPVLAQRQLSIRDEDTTGSLTMRLAGLGAGLLSEVLPRWQRGELATQPQDEAKATYSQLIAKEAGEMDWHLPAPQLWRQVRAFQPWPGSYTWWRGRRLKILEAIPLPGGGGEVGRVVALGAGQPPAGVVTGEGVLGLRRVQLEGKRPLEIAEFLRGQRSFLGSQLPQPR